MSKNARTLLTNGRELDGILNTRWNRWLVQLVHWLPMRLVLWWIPAWQVILVLDQLSRHLQRTNPLDDNFTNECLYEYTARAFQYVPYATEENTPFCIWPVLSVNMRHHLRSVAQRDCRSTEHYRLDRLMQERIAHVQSWIEWQTNLNSHNRSQYRLHRALVPVNWGTADQACNVPDSYFSAYENTSVARYLLEKFRAFNNPPLHFCLLLSGGLDSMSILRFLSRHRAEFACSALHIDWHRRTESTLEAQQLQNFCLRAGVLLRVVDSTVDPQDPEWEKKSTEFRMATLRQLKTPYTVYVTGHVQSDILENYITNGMCGGSAAGKNVFDLFGMSEFESSNSLTFFRPLLLHPKPTETGMLEDRGGAHTLIPPTLYFADNATNLDHRRRIVRRALAQIEGISTTKVTRLYYQLQAMRKLLPTPNVTENDVHSSLLVTFATTHIRNIYLLHLIVNEYLHSEFFTNNGNGGDKPPTISVGAIRDAIRRQERAGVPMRTIKHPRLVLQF